MNQSRMIADDMAVFAQVVEHNGFTAAARRLKVPKVRVSRAVAALEKALGVRLLERTTRRIGLTVAGKSILGALPGVALEVEAARAALQPVAEGAQLARRHRPGLRPPAGGAAGAALPGNASLR